MRATGSDGELRVGYQRAARLAGWRLELLPALPRRFAFTATVAWADDYWRLQPRFDLIARIGCETWTWYAAVAGPVERGAVIAIELTARPHVTREAGERHG